MCWGQSNSFTTKDVDGECEDCGTKRSQMRTYTNELFELEIARQRAEAAQQDLKKAQSEVKHAKEALRRHQNTVNWYKWIDIVLNELGDGWTIASDTSKPDVCGEPDLLSADCYKGKVEFSQHGSPVRVWTHQQGVLYVGGTGIQQRVWSMIGPSAMSVFKEVNRYILEVNVDVATLLKISPKKVRREKA